MLSSSDHIGGFVLTGSKDGARLWEIKSGRELRQMQQNLKFVNSVAISPNGKLALTGSNDNSARLWEIESGRELHRLQGHTKSVESVAFSPDGQNDPLKDQGQHLNWQEGWNENGASCQFKRDAYYSTQPLEGYFH